VRCGQAPKITDLQWPEPLKPGTSDFGTISFQDEDRDVVKVRFQHFDGASWVDVGQFDPGVKGMSAGSFPFELACPDETGFLRFQVQLEDEEGNTSAWSPFRLTCADPDVRVILSHDSRSAGSHPVGVPINFLATVEGFGDETLTYEWWIEGDAQGASSASVSWSNPAPVGTYSVEVSVSDNLGRRAEASFTINVVETQEEESGLMINGVPFDPAEGIEISLDEGELAELQISCRKIEGTLNLTMLQVFLSRPEDDDSIVSSSTYRMAAILKLISDGGGGDVVRAIDICSKLGFFGLDSVPQEGDAPHTAKPTQSPPSFTIHVELLQGGVRFETKQDAVPLEVETSATKATAEGVVTFQMGHNPDTKQSHVVANKGALKIQPQASGSGSFTLNGGQQVVVDRSGSGPVTLIGSVDPQLPGNGLSLPQALDSNGNGVLDDVEVRAAIQIWILGQTVPGTDETIDDTTMRSLIQMWIMGTPVNQQASAAAMTARLLNVQSIALSAPGPTLRTVNIRWRNVSSVRVQVFDLNGRLQIEAENSGPQLQFNLLNRAGRPLANGVYLYAVITHGMDGTIQRHNIRKMIVMR
jgi:hypothetical protein